MSVEERFKNSFELSAPHMRVSYKGASVISDDPILHSRDFGFVKSFDFPNPKYRESTMSYSVLNKVFSEITTEMFCRTHTALAKSYTEYEMHPQYYINAYALGHRPDLIITDPVLFEKGTVIELKSRAIEVTEEMYQSELKEIEKYKTQLVPAVKLIIFNPRIDFINDMYHPQEHINIYNHVLYLRTKKITGKPYRLDMQFDNTLNPASIFNRDGFLESAYKELDEMGELIKDDTSTFNDHVDELIYIADKTEDFFNNNFMESNKGALEGYKDVLSRIVTIFGEHPYNRDKNRIASRSLTGNKSNRLMTTLFANLSTEEVNINELISDIDGIEQQFMRAHYEANAVTKLRKVNKKLGILLGISKKLEILRFEESYENKIKSLINKHYEKLKTIIGDANGIISNKDKVTITKHGGVQLTDVRPLLKYKLLTKRELKVSGLERYNYHIRGEAMMDHMLCEPETLEKYLRNIDQSFENLPTLKVREFKNFYSGLGVESLDDILVKKSNGSIEKLRSDNTFKYLYNNRKIIEQYIMDVPSVNVEYNNKHDFFVSKIENLNIWTLSTVAPNEITTGVLINVSVHTKKVNENDYGMYNGRWIERNNGTYIFISAPYRLNHKICTQYNNIIGAYVGLFLTMDNYNVKLPLLLKSLFLDYNRQLAKILDHIYLLYKNSLSNFTMGRLEMSSEFSDIYLKDMRISVIVQLLVNNYGSFVNSIKGDFKNINKSLKDPIFGISLNDMQVFLGLVYLKQIFPKVDGYDDVERTSFFVGKDLEQDFAAKLSKFADEKMKSVYHLTGKKFCDLLFEGNEWEATSQSPSHIHKGVIEIVNQVRDNRGGISLSFQDLELPNIGKTSRILTQNKLFGVEDPKPQIMINKNGKEYIRNPVDINRFGFTSRELTETQLLVSELVLKSWKDPNNIQMYEENGYKCDAKGRYHAPIGHSARISDAIFYLIPNMPEYAIVSTKVKDQTGHSKRLFYIQDIHSYFLAKYVDTGFQDLLYHSNLDFLSRKGDDKFMILEKMLSTFGSDMTHITCDETKFGDLYPLLALKWVIRGLYDCGFMDRDQAAISLKMLQRLEKRSTILTSEISKTLKKSKNGIENESQKVREFIKKLKSHNILFPRELFSGINIDLNRNEYYTKSVGFVLGVLNRLGSLASAIHMLYKMSAIRKICPNLKVDGRSHSDDSIIFLDMPNIRMDYRNVDTKEVRKNVLGSVKNYTLSSGRILEYDKSWRGKPQDKTAQVSKLIYKLVLVGSRLVGQRMSIKKFALGNAGEILQHYLVGNKCVPCILKPIVTCFTSMSYTGPTDDIISAISRISPLFTYNAQYALCSTIQLFINLYIYDYYGICAEELNQNNPIEVNGIWYTNPALFEKIGMLGNESRLLAHHKIHPQDTKSINIYKLMLNTKNVLRDKDDVSDHLEIDGRIKEAGISDGSQSNIPTCKKKFVINHTGDSKSKSAFFSLFDVVYESTIEGIIRTLETTPEATSSKYNDEMGNYLGMIIGNRNLVKLLSDRTSKSVKLLCKKYSKLKVDEHIINGSSKYIKAKFIKESAKMFSELSIFKSSMDFVYRINVLSRYLKPSFQAVYAHVRTARKVISAHGYYKRNIFKPFMLDYSKEEFMEIKDIYHLINKYAESDHPINKVNDNFYQFCKELYSEPTKLVISYKFDIQNKRENITQDIELKKRWVSLIHRDMPSLFNYPPSDLISAIVEVEKKKIDIDDTELFRQKPRYRLDPMFRAAVITITQTCRKYGIFDENLHSNLTVLTQLFTNMSYTKILRLSEDAGENIMFGYIFTVSEDFQVEIDETINEELSYQQSLTLTNDLAYNYMIRQEMVKFDGSIPEDFIYQKGVTTGSGFDKLEDLYNHNNYYVQMSTTNDIRTRMLHYICGANFYHGYLPYVLFKDREGGGISFIYKDLQSKLRVDYIQIKNIRDKLHIFTNIFDIKVLDKWVPFIDKYTNGNKYQHKWRSFLEDTDIGVFKERNHELYYNSEGGSKSIIKGEQLDFEKVAFGRVDKNRVLYSYYNKMHPLDYVNHLSLTDERNYSGNFVYASYVNPVTHNSIKVIEDIDIVKKLPIEYQPELPRDPLLKFFTTYQKLVRGIELEVIPYPIYLEYMSYLYYTEPIRNELIQLIDHEDFESIILITIARYKQETSSNIQNAMLFALFSAILVRDNLTDSVNKNLIRRFNKILLKECKTYNQILLILIKPSSEFFKLTKGIYRGERQSLSIISSALDKIYKTSIRIRDIIDPRQMMLRVKNDTIKVNKFLLKYNPGVTDIIDKL